jgi:hypothetical protein
MGYERGIIIKSDVLGKDKGERDPSLGFYYHFLIKSFSVPLLLFLDHLWVPFIL